MINGKIPRINRIKSRAALSAIRASILVINSNIMETKLKIKYKLAIRQSDGKLAFMPFPVHKPPYFTKTIYGTVKDFINSIKGKKASEITKGNLYGRDGIISGISLLEIKYIDTKEIIFKGYKHIKIQ